MPIKVVSIMEANSVTGPAKNLLEFASRSRSSSEGAERIEVSLIAYRRGQEPESAFIRAAREASIPIDVAHEKGRFDTAVIPRMREIVSSRAPDIVQTHNVKSHFLMRRSGLWKTLPWIAFHHGYTTEDWKMRTYNQANRWSLRVARCVVTVCRPFAEELAAQGVPRERIQIRHNAVNRFVPPGEAALAQARAGIPAPAGTPLLVSIGRLSSEKGHADLIRAMVDLRDVRPKCHLVIVGDGVERAALERMCIGNDVTFVGFQPDVRPYYCMADAVVLPSHSEGSPNVLLEAMAAGCSIVATEVGGIPEVVRDGETAVLVRPGSPQALARAISGVLNDPEGARRRGARAREVAEAEYSPEAYRRAMAALYAGVLRG